MDSLATPASQSTSSSAIVLASAVNHSAPSNFIGYFLGITKPGDIRILWKRINVLGEIEQRCFDAHQDVVCRQSKRLAATVRLEYQKQQKIPQWRKKHDEKTIITVDLCEYEEHIVGEFLNFLYRGRIDLLRVELELLDTGVDEELQVPDRTTIYTLELRFPTPKILVSRIKDPLLQQSASSTVAPNPSPSMSPESTISSASTLLPSPSPIRGLPAKALITIANIFVMAAEQDVRELEDWAVIKYNNLLNTLTDPLENDDFGKSLRLIRNGFQDTTRWKELKRPYARLIIENRNRYKKDGEKRSRAEKLAQLLESLESLQ